MQIFHVRQNKIKKKTIKEKRFSLSHFVDCVRNSLDLNDSRGAGWIFNCASSARQACCSYAHAFY